MERINKKWCANVNDWKNWKPYPYKGYTLTNPQYIKDRDETFAENGNGWWWNDGSGLYVNEESPMERQKRYKIEKRRNK